MTQGMDIEVVTRQRLRSLRTSRGWSLDDLARRSHIGASTISRLETGVRRIALDQLVGLARALDTTVDDLLAHPEHDDIIIRPTQDTANDITFWHLTRSDDPSGRKVAKVRFPTARADMQLQVHPGREWLFVLKGTARVALGDREQLVRVGEAADFDTMTPHWIGGEKKPVDALMIFDHHGESAHLRTK